ncbi:MAG: T9SS type A sorting domain-containing protein [Moheibacter sp.]
MKQILQIKKEKMTIINYLIVLLFLFFSIFTFAQTTRYVNGSIGNDIGDCTEGSGPCATIGYAIEQSISGDAIEVANGIYTTETLNIDKSLSIIGESETGTIIQAEEVPLNPLEVARRVFFIEGNGVHVTIANAHIRHGAEAFGGGVWLYHAALTLSSVTLSHNTSIWAGGGLLVTGPEAMANLMNVTFLENNNIDDGSYGGGMASEDYASSNLINVDFIGNESYQGGGLNVQGGFHTFKNLNFIDNATTHFGAGIFSSIDTDLNLINVLFEGNTASRKGGGIYAYDTNLNMINVTLSGNSASWDGGGICTEENTTVAMNNSIIYGNTAIDGGNEISNGGNCAMEINYSIYDDQPGDLIVGGGISFLNSITDDPLFVDAENGNLRLTEDSPAVDSGNPDTDILLFPTNGNNEPIDLDINPRVYFNGIDIGAYEANDLLSVNNSSDINLIYLYPNPTTGIINIKTEEPITQAGVYTITGSKLPIQLSETDNTIDISDLSTGIYFVRITVNNQSQTYKIIKE